MAWRKPGSGHRQTNRRTRHLASGGIAQVPTGVNLTVVEPKAAGGYVDYVKYQLHLIAAGMGITYEMMTGDVREVNFSSARVSMLEFRRNAEAMQWLTLIPRLCQPIWQAFIEAAALAGKVRPATLLWTGPPQVGLRQPRQDVKADLAEISGGLTTISEKLRKRGYKPELVFDELKRDFDRLRADGTSTSCCKSRPTRPRLRLRQRPRINRLSFPEMRQAKANHSPHDYRQRQKPALQTPWRVAASRRHPSPLPATIANPPPV